MMSNDEYHSLPGFSNSMASVLAEPKGPQLFYGRFIAKTLLGPKSDAMDVGELVHCMTLEPDEFWERYAEMPAGLDRVRKAGKIAWNVFESGLPIGELYVCDPGVNRRTTAGKVEYAEFLSTVDDRDIVSVEDFEQARSYVDQLWATQNKKIIKREEYETALACADALRGHDQIGPILAIQNAMIEKPLFFELDGVDCRCKLDWCSLDHQLIVDIKTSRDASPTKRGFDGSCSEFGFDYDRQAGVYRHAVELLTGIRCRFLFAVVETEPPYAVACYEPSERRLNAGFERFAKLLAEYRYRYESGDWLQDWSKGIVPLE